MLEYSVFIGLIYRESGIFFTLYTKPFILNHIEGNDIKEN